MLSLLSFILALAILIAIHEFGHFWVARRCGVKVLKFSIGFGKPLWQKTAKDGTNYVLAMIPLGGYVKMLDEREGPVPEEQLNQAFNRKPLRDRVAIAAAGPTVAHPRKLGAIPEGRQRHDGPWRRAHVGLSR